MKHDRLCAIGHNLADSMASGLGFVIGYYEMDVFGEAARSEHGSTCVDFLSGKIVQGDASDSLQRAAALFAEALPKFCRQHGASADDFVELSTTFSSVLRQQRAILTVTDKEGRRSVTEYGGNPLKRLKILDPLGRIRRTTRKAALS